MTSTAKRPLATMQAAAEYLGVSERTVRRWISAGIVRAERFGPRLVRIDLESIQGRPLQYKEGTE